MAVAAYVMMIFFTLLTFVLAIFNPVSDCGCFGDAIKLTNWQTFFKNLLTLPFAWIIFRNKDRYDDELAGWRVFSLSLVSVIFAVGISVYSYRNLPMLDFRPFKTGTNIPEAMKIPEGALQPEYKSVFILEKDGVKKHVAYDPIKNAMVLLDITFPKGALPHDISGVSNGLLYDLKRDLIWAPTRYQKMWVLKIDPKL